MTDMPNFWWCPEHHLYRGGIERPCAEAVKLGDVERMRQELSAANAAEAEWHKLATAAVKGAEKANRERDALRAEIRAVLDELADASADGQTHREEDYGPDAVRHRAYARGLSYAVDCLRAIVEREPSSPPDDEHHVIEFREDGWTIKHPLACRPTLFDCRVNRAAERDLREPPAELGRFECGISEDDRLVVGERVQS